jgi:thymidylate kinase
LVDEYAAAEKPDYIERVKRNFRGLASLVDGLVFVDTSNKPELVAQEVSQKVDAYFKQRK